MYKVLDAPLSVHLEFTSRCDYECRHCYNFWRPSGNVSSSVLTKELAAKVVEQLSESGVFHVILTGGEPLLNIDVLVFVMKELAKRGIDFSLNSNASLLTEKRAKVLRKAGLKTILISLLSYDEATQDFITNRSGSYERTVRGIVIARANRIRVAINMVVSKSNLTHVVKTGLFAKNLGAVCFSATRVMPPRYDGTELVTPEFILSGDDIKSIMHQMVQLRDSGLQLESLVPYPACFFENPEEIQIFGGRTCSAGKTSCAIGADTSVRACPHHEESYGRLDSESLKAIWAKLGYWRDGSFLPSECKTCPGIARCGGGCRIAAPGKDICSKDPLMLSSQDIHPTVKNQIIALVGMNTVLRVCRRCRFRDDSAMGIVNTEGIKNTFVNHDTLRLLREVSEGPAFTPEQLRSKYSIKMGDSGYLNFLSNLVDKNILELVK